MITFVVNAPRMFLVKFVSNGINFLSVFSRKIIEKNKERKKEKKEMKKMKIIERKI